MVKKIFNLKEIQIDSEESSSPKEAPVQPDPTESNAVINVFEDTAPKKEKSSDDGESVADPSTLGMYFYDYTNKINDPIEDKGEFGPFESYDEVYGIFSFIEGKLYALSNNPDVSLFVNSEEYDAFQKVPIGEDDVLQIANHRYVITERRTFDLRSAKKAMGKLLVKKSSVGTQKTLEEREAEIESFEGKIFEHQNSILELEKKLQQIDQNKNKVVDLETKVAKWTQDIISAKELILKIQAETTELEKYDYEKDIDELETEIHRLEKIKFTLVEKAKHAKQRLIKMQEAEEKKKQQINSDLLVIEKEQEELKKKLEELEKKKKQLKE